jgi:hypothetical protein
MRMPADHWFRESFIQGKWHVPGLPSGPEVVTLRRGCRRGYLVPVVPPTVFSDMAAAGALFLVSTLPLTMLFPMMAAGLV